MNISTDIARHAASPLGTPFVFGQLGQTLDGRIACHNGASKYINGSDALDHLHGLRAEVDAVLVGVGTVIADNPQLTVRRCSGQTPRAIVIDPRRRMPQDAVLMSAGDAPPLFIRHENDVRCDADVGVPCLEADADEGLLDPVAIVRALCARGYGRILIEGGSSTLSHFINHRAIDRLHILMAPIILGSGVNGLNLARIDSLDEALRPSVQVSLFDDGDVLYECAFESAWSKDDAIR
ncbi:RibD family protein [Pararhizobium haloflavum]|uniref:RibD family protein n=1 Tax=Pararhizobium haloflavum TaxID=2037914 RepID=UPI001FE0EF67|nr:RibD family protein [Pararhizobium haloflavum]